MTKHEMDAIYLPGIRMPHGVRLGITLIMLLLILFIASHFVPCLRKSRNKRQY